MIDGVSMLK